MNQTAMNTLFRLLVLPTIFGIGSLAASWHRAEAGPLATFTLHPGLDIQCVAAEPLVADPIAFDWGPDGRLWVVEMADYPTGAHADGTPGSRVRVLEDIDHDGVYDRSTLFCDRLNYPTGVLVWRRGILVTAAPDLLYLEDTNGDGHADRRQVLFTGFRQGNPQHRINGLAWGLDNWVHLANGDSGGTIVSARTGQRVDLAGHDIRIRPDQGAMELETGMSQFGRSRDDWGNWFGCSNSNPMWHFVLEDRYLRRNPHVAVGSVRKNVSVQPGTARVFPTSRTEARFNEPWAANRFTSACSVIVYRDSLLGKEFAGNSFVCEPVHNLIHREVMAGDGPTFVSHRADEEGRSEFLASSDSSFRPTTVRTGPDGCLWIADMHRQVIEHPEWIPKNWQKKLDLRAGEKQGRIYRVRSKRVAPRDRWWFDRIGTEQLVDRLNSPNGWQRDMAQRLLIWGADARAGRALERLFRSSHRPRTRLQSLATLDGLGRLTDDVIIAALGDPDPAVRRRALCLSEPRLATAPPVVDAVLSLSGERDPRVQLQLACTLGACNEPRAGAILGVLAVRHTGDPYFTAAILSSATGPRLGPLLTRALEGQRQGLSLGPMIAKLMQTAVALDQRDLLRKSLTSIALPHASGSYAAWQLDAIGGMLDAINRRGAQVTTTLGGEAAGRPAAMVAFARKVAADVAADVAAKDATLANADASGVERAAVRLLGRLPTDREADMAVLLELLSARPTSTRPASHGRATSHDARPIELAQRAARSAQLRGEALASLARTGDRRVAGALLKRWTEASPKLREQMAGVLLERAAWTGAFLAAIESGTVSPDQVSTTARQRLLSHRNEAFRRRAESLFAVAGIKNRAELVERYQDVVGMPGNRTRGESVFAKRCAACHRIEETGYPIGPDVTALTDKSPATLLTAILDPNRAVEDKFLSHTVITNDGRIVAGLLAAQDGSSITLEQQEGRHQVILRKDIDEIVSSKQSLMPEGLEKDLTRRDLADVIAYIRFVGPRPKEIAGNHPRVVAAAADGALHLAATTGEIFGNDISIDPNRACLIDWTSRLDHVVWSVDVPRTGPYDVWIEWSADKAWSNDGFVIEGQSGKRLDGTVPATAGPQAFERRRLGRMVLTEGSEQIVFRARGAVHGELLRLKAIELRPVQ